MRKSIFLMIVVIAVGACAPLFPEVQHRASLPLPFVHEPMEDAAFWINRLPEPDRVIMSEAEIEAFNERNTRPDIFMTDILDYPPTIEKTKVSEIIGSLRSWAREHALFGHDNFPISQEFFSDIDANIECASPPGTVIIRFGMTVAETDLRVLPTAEIGMEAPSEYEFDQLQQSLLAPGTPVAVVWKTKDGLWFLIVSPYATGWAAAEKIGIARSKDGIRHYLSQDPFLVVTGSVVDLYSDRSLSCAAGRLRLGCRVPIVDRSDETYAVMVPVRTFSGRLKFERAYIGGDAPVHEGWLPYTGRNVLTVAFSMADSSYGWGGMFGYWDCSSFVRDVFSVFGISLPRNTKSQAMVGIPRGRFEKGVPVSEKYELLDGADPGATLLIMPGHVMIYLGHYGGRYYVIHDLWAYRSREVWGRSVINGVGRVIVSELNLGQGGKSGSLIERIIDVIEVR